MNAYTELSGDSLDTPPSRHRWYVRAMWCCLLSAGFITALTLVLQLPRGASSPQAQVVGEDQVGVANLANIMPGILARTPSLKSGAFLRGLQSSGPHGRQRLYPLGQVHGRNTNPSGHQTVLPYLEAEAKPFRDSHVQEVRSEEDLDNILEQSSGLVVLKVCTAFCNPCKLFSPKYESVAGELSGQAAFLQMNKNENDSTNHVVKQRLKTKTVPTFYFFRDGKLVAEHTCVDKNDFVSNLNKHILAQGERDLPFLRT
jgi:thiol-disulfide isomerase/thioredoxin